MDTSQLPSAADRAAAGAALLDKHRPGWDTRVNPATLAIASDTRCVLTQDTGTGDYQAAAVALLRRYERPLEAAVSYGFNGDYQLGTIEWMNDCDALTAAWRAIITARQATDE